MIPSDSSSLQKAFGEFKEQLGFIKDKGFAEAKLMVAGGLRIVSFPAKLLANRIQIAGIMNKALQNVANDFSLEAQKTRAKVPATSLAMHIKKLGTELINEIKNRFRTITPTKPPLKPTPPNSQSPRQKLAQDAVAIINGQIKDTSDGKYLLSSEDSSILKKKFMECLNKPMNDVEFRKWIDATFRGKDKDHQREAIYNLMPMLLRGTEGFVVPKEEPMTDQELETLLVELPSVRLTGQNASVPSMRNQMDALSATLDLPHAVDTLISKFNVPPAVVITFVDSYREIRSAKPDIDRFSETMKTIKTHIDTMPLTTQQKAVLKAAVAASLLKECVAGWDTHRTIQSKPLALLTAANKEDVKSTVSPTDYADFIEIYDQFSSLEIPNIDERVKVNSLIRNEIKEHLEHLPIAKDRIVRNLLMQ